MDFSREPFWHWLCFNVSTQLWLLAILDARGEKFSSASRRRLTPTHASLAVRLNTDTDVDGLWPCGFGGEKSRARLDFSTRTATSGVKLTFGFSWAGLWNSARLDDSRVAVTGFGRIGTFFDALPPYRFLPDDDGVERPNNFRRPGVRRFGVRVFSFFNSFLEFWIYKK